MKEIISIVAVAVLLWLPMPAGAVEFGGLLDQAKDLGSGSLTSLIGQQVNAEPSQIEGGLGSLLSMAGEQLGAADYGKIAAAIPGADGYLDTARSLGVLDSPITSMDGLNAALGKLGMSSDTIARFVPVAVDALGQVGGPEVAKLLGSLTGG